MIRTKSIWILESEKKCTVFYEEALSIRYSLRFFTNLKDFEKAFSSELGSKPDLVIAEIRLPDASFLNFLDFTRTKNRTNVPILIVSAIDDVDILRFCYKQGVSDYIIKPFRKSEIIAKTERIILSKSTSGDEFFINAVKQIVCRDNQCSFPLTSRELQILDTLKQAPGKTLTKEQLFSQVWENLKVGGKCLDVHLFNLRRKIRPLGLDIYYVSPASYKLMIQENTQVC